MHGHILGLWTVIWASFALVNAQSGIPSVVYPNAPPPPAVDNQTSAYWLAYNGYYIPEASVLTSTDLRNNSFDIQPYVANGYIGSRIPNMGNGLAYDVNMTNSSGSVPTYGWPLGNPRSAGAYLGGFYGLQDSFVHNNGTRENISSSSGPEQFLADIPQWTTLVLTDMGTGQRLDNMTNLTQLSNWSQSQSLRNGIVQTNYTWTPQGAGGSYNVSYTIFAHRTQPGLGVVRMDIVSNFSGQVAIMDKLDASDAQRATFVTAGAAGTNQIWTAVSPEGRSNVTAFEYSTLVLQEPSAFSNANETLLNGTAIQQQFQGSLQAGQAAAVVKYVGIVSNASFPGAVVDAQSFSTQAASMGWDSVLESHIAGWQFLWNEGDINIPGDHQLDLAVRSSMFNLLTNVYPPKPEANFSLSFPEAGLSSDAWAGYIFEEADISTAPALLPQFPYLSSSSLRYRFALLTQAEQNAQQLNYSGALYPPSSSLYGNCTDAANCGVDFTTDFGVALEMWNYFASTNDTTFLMSVGWPTIQSIANFYSSFVELNTTTGNYSTNSSIWFDKTNVTDRAIYNYPIAQIMTLANMVATLAGQPMNQTWTNISSHIVLPANDTLDLVLEYPGMNGTSWIAESQVPQLIYPLMSQNISRSRALNTLDYFSYYQSPDQNDPQLFAFTAIGKAWLEMNGCSAYTYLLRASQPFLRRPFYYMSSVINDNSSLFEDLDYSSIPNLSSHGSLLQVYLYGFTGYVPRPDAMYFDPSIPPQLNPGYEITGLKYQGSTFDVNVSLISTTIQRTDNGTGAASAVNVTIGSRNAMAGNYTLRPNETLVVPTWRSDLNGTAYPGDIAQCKPALSSEYWRPGQFPLAITDGDNSTAWQPLFNNKSALQLDLGTVQSFSNAYFFWGRSPPLKVSLGIVISPNPPKPPPPQSPSYIPVPPFPQTPTGPRTVVPTTMNNTVHPITTPNNFTHPTTTPVINSTLSAATNFTYFNSSLPTMTARTSVPPIFNSTVPVNSSIMNITSTLPINTTVVPVPINSSGIITSPTSMNISEPVPTVTPQPVPLPITPGTVMTSSFMFNASILPVSLSQVFGPSTPAATSAPVVATSPVVPVKRAGIDQPNMAKRADNYQPAVAGSTNVQVHWILLDVPVSISEPFDPSKNYSVINLPIIGNSSDYPLNDTYNAQYVIIAIEGNSNSSSPFGGTLGELVLT